MLRYVVRLTVMVFDGMGSPMASLAFFLGMPPVNFWFMAVLYTDSFLPGWYSFGKKVKIFRISLFVVTELVWWRTHKAATARCEEVHTSCLGSCASTTVSHCTMDTSAPPPTTGSSVATGTETELELELELELATGTTGTTPPTCNSSVATGTGTELELELGLGTGTTPSTVGASKAPPPTTGTSVGSGTTAAAGTASKASEAGAAVESIGLVERSNNAYDKEAEVCNCTLF